MAAALQIVRLTGRPVLLPLTALTAGIGEFRAHLYAAWHSGRKHSGSISRAAQARVTGVPKRSQRVYCRRARVRCRPNLAVGPRYSRQRAQEMAWRQGRAIFEFRDGSGKQGPPGGRYIAWQLPNSYSGPLRQTNAGNVRPVNRRLKDLVHHGAQGNGSRPAIPRRYARRESLARIATRLASMPSLWPAKLKAGPFEVWYQLCSG